MVVITIVFFWNWAALFLGPPYGYYNTTQRPNLR